MAQTARKLATWDDVLRAPEGSATEVVGGELFAMARPPARHGRTQGALWRRIGAPFDDDGEPGGWWIVIEADVRLGAHDIVQPDLVGWRRERLPELPHTRPVDVVPDWVCEVLSDSTRGHDRLRKLPLYLRAGVPHAWLVDPDARTVEAYQADGSNWRLLGTYGDGDQARIPPFEAVTIDVARLFLPRKGEG